VKNDDTDCAMGLHPLSKNPGFIFVGTCAYPWAGLFKGAFSLPVLCVRATDLKIMPR
jgi:hypothetical protein